MKRDLNEIALRWRKFYGVFYFLVREEWKDVVDKKIFIIEKQPEGGKYAKIRALFLMDNSIDIA